MSFVRLPGQNSRPQIVYHSCCPRIEVRKITCKCQNVIRLGILHLPPAQLTWKRKSHGSESSIFASRAILPRPCAVLNVRLAVAFLDTGTPAVHHNASSSPQPALQTEPCLGLSELRKHFALREQVHDNSCESAIDICSGCQSVAHMNAQESSLAGGDFELCQSQMLPSIVHQNLIDFVTFQLQRWPQLQQEARGRAAAQAQNGHGAVRNNARKRCELIPVGFGPRSGASVHAVHVAGAVQQQNSAPRVVARRVLRALQDHDVVVLAGPAGQAFEGRRFLILNFNVFLPALLDLGRSIRPCAPAAANLGSGSALARGQLVQLPPALEVHIGPTVGMLPTSVYFQPPPPRCAQRGIASCIRVQHFSGFQTSARVSW
ncbi:hypothetical protein Mapa_006074 [Marchantia paleacea]|nr:hypothetical protein Mapa_006074 [Marchantia paleacea]